MNLPNQLTVFRLGLAAAFVFVLSLGFRGQFTVAAVLFALAAFTDYLDGAIARRRNLITDFGKLMDPLADKILTASAFVLLAVDHAIPAWAVIVIISREFLITGLRTLAGAKGIVLPAEKLGKHKTAWQMITIVYFLVLLSWREWVRDDSLALSAAWNLGGAALVGVTVVLTVYSGLAYFWRNRALLVSM
jgi:CDP-diacylglycerol--glycerol-3-phosphate 3-phosphatidyltransferase